MAEYLPMNAGILVQMTGCFLEYQQEGYMVNAGIPCGRLIGVSMASAPEVVWFSVLLCGSLVGVEVQWNWHQSQLFPPGTFRCRT